MCCENKPPNADKTLCLTYPRPYENDLKIDPPVTTETIIQGKLSLP